MKKNRKIARNLALIAIPAFVAVPLIATPLINFSKRNFNLQKPLNLENSKINLASKNAANNIIYSKAETPAYAQKHLVDAESVNRIDLFNGQSALSTQSIKTVRNKDWFFNFINDVTGGVAGKSVRIIATSSDENNPRFASFETTFREIIGSAQWANNFLIVVGLSQTARVEIQTFKMEGASLEHVQTLTDPLLSKMYDASIPLTTITGFPNPTFRAGWLSNAEIVPAGFTPYDIISNPVALSPIVNFDNPDAPPEFIIWPLNKTVSEIRSSGILKLRFNPNGQLIIEPLGSIAPPSTHVDVLSSKVLALTPSIDNGILDIVGHLAQYTKDGVVPPSSDLAIYNIINFNPLDPTMIPVASPLYVSPNGRSSSSNPFAVQPYGLIAKGGLKDKDSDNSNRKNIFWILSQNLDYAVPTQIFSTPQDSLTKEFISPQTSGFTFTNPIGNADVEWGTTTYTFDQYSYSNSGNLTDGFYVTFNGRGQKLFADLGASQTQLGYIKWASPWDNELWGSGLFDENSKFITYLPGVLPKDSFFLKTMPTIFDGVMADVGLKFPILDSPNARGPIEIRNFNISTQRNSWNTSIPITITLPKSTPAVDGIPINLTVAEISKIIFNNTLDLPNSTFLPSIERKVIEGTNNITISSNLERPFINGVRINGGSSFMVDILEYPNIQNIDDGIKVNVGNNLFSNPSDITSKMSNTLNNRGLVQIPGIIGDSSSDLIQINKSFWSIIKSFTTTTDDLMGTLNFKIEMVDNNGLSTTFQQTIYLFGYIYFVPIGVGIIALFSLIAWLVVFLTIKRNKNKLKDSLAFGFTMSNQTNDAKKANKILTPPKSKMGPGMGPGMGPRAGGPMGPGMGPRAGGPMGPGMGPQKK